MALPFEMLPTDSFQLKVIEPDDAEACNPVTAKAPKGTRPVRVAALEPVTEVPMGDRAWARRLME
jgi:hypothetical protein